MANQECPKCGAHFSSSDDWAKSALSTLMPAPAVRDMATQLRCPQCGYVFAESEVSYLRPSVPAALKILLILSCLALLFWAVY